jgi:hypothetical protein
MIAKTLDSADEGMLEGRQRVHVPGRDATTVNELSEGLASFVKDFSRTIRHILGHAGRLGRQGWRNEGLNLLTRES